MFGVSTTYRVIVAKDKTRSQSRASSYFRPISGSSYRPKCVAFFSANSAHLSGKSSAA